MAVALVHLRQPLRDLAGGSSQVEVPGDTLGEVLTRLEHEHPRMSGWVLDEQGRIREHVNVFLNGDRAGTDAPVAERDRIHVIQSISGGFGGVARPEWHEGRTR